MGMLLKNKLNKKRKTEKVSSIPPQKQSKEEGRSFWHSTEQDLSKRKKDAIEKKK